MNIKQFAFNLYIDPVRTEMTYTQQITIFRIFSLDKSELKGIIMDKNLLKVWFTDKSESERVIVDDFSTEESKSEWVQKSINKEKDAKKKTDNEYTSVDDNSVVK